MTFSEVNSLADTRVYAQDTAPADTRDGIIWVDTSLNPRETKVRSGATGTWEAIADIEWSEVSNKPTTSGETTLSGGYKHNWDYNLPNDNANLSTTTTLNGEEVADGVKIIHNGDGNAPQELDNMTIRYDDGTADTFNLGNIDANTAFTKEFSFSWGFVESITVRTNYTGDGLNENGGSGSVELHELPVAPHSHQL